MTMNNRMSRWPDGQMADGQMEWPQGFLLRSFLCRPVSPCDLKTPSVKRIVKANMAPNSASRVLGEGNLKHAFLAMLAICLLAYSAATARADYTMVEVNFLTADKNGDLLLSKTEYLLIPLEAFRKLDSDGSNALEPEELGDLAKDPEFADGDADKNGSLSLEEVITEKLADFKAADDNNDGALNVDEVVTYEKK